MHLLMAMVVHVLLLITATSNSKMAPMVLNQKKIFFSKTEC